jgi:hypothetical protein
VRSATFVCVVNVPQMVFLVAVRGSCHLGNLYIVE